MLSPAERDLIRRDRALPGLATLLDAGAFRDALQGSTEVQIGEARLDYLRYKPGQNCLAAYTLDVAGAEVLCHAKAYRRCDDGKLAKAEMRPAIPGVLGGGRFLWPRTRLEVCVFPNDNKLGSLALLSDAARRAGFLRRHLPGHAELWQGAVRTLAYKPGRRWVGAFVANGTPLAVGKFYDDSAFAAARAKARCFRNGDVLRLAPLIGRSRGRGALFFGWQRGELLSQAMLAPTFDPAVMFRVGVALAEFQRQPTANLHARSGATEADALVRLGEFLEFLLPAEAERIRSIATRLAVHFGALSPGTAVVHGDFYAKQILFAGEEITVLDLDEAARGAAADDLGTFLAHLECEVALGKLNPSQVTKYRSQLLAGFAAEAGRADPGPVALYTAARLFGRLPQFFRNHDPEWPQRTRATLERVATLLGEISPSQRSGFETLDCSSRREPDPTSAGTFMERTKVRCPGDQEAAEATSELMVGFDVKLPALEGALSPRVVTSKLAAALAAAQPDLEAVTLQSATLRRHKPGRRALIEYQLELRCAGRTQSLALFGKMRRRGVDYENVAAVRELIASGFAANSGDEISIPEVVGALSEVGMTLQRWVSGRPLAEWLTEADGVAAARRAADAICKLHRSGVRMRKTHPISAELEILEDRLSALAAQRPELAWRLNLLLGECRKLAARLHLARPRLIHRDFYHDQLLLEGRRVWLLDLDLLCLGDPALDAGNFVGHLIEWGVRAPGHRRALAAAAAAFTERWLEQSDPAQPAVVEVYTTLALARHVSLSAQFPERAAFTERILALCEERCARRPEILQPTELVAS